MTTHDPRRFPRQRPASAIASLLWAVALCPSTTAFASEGFGNYLNASFAGDGTTPSIMERFQDSRPAVSPAPLGMPDPSGGVSHGVTLPLPAGLLQPSLSFDYSSGGGDHSWLGRGWSLSTGMRVTRARGAEVTLAHELGHADVQEVWNVSGGGASGRLLILDGDAVWQSEQPSHVVLVSDDVISGELVVQVDDVVWTLQHPEAMDPTLTSGAESRVWLPVKAQDTVGNRIEWSWTGSRLDTIRYGANDTVSMRDHHVEVRFVYDENLAIHESYDGSMGFLEHIDRRLESVQVWTDDGSGTLGHRRSFELSYDYDEHPLLAEVLGTNVATGLVHFEDGGIVWCEKLPGRGTGWSSQPTSDSVGYDGPSLEEGLQRMKAQLKDVEVDHDGGLISTPGLGETYLEQSIQELNGDGLVARTRAVEGEFHWRVWLGDGHGFADDSIVWDAPLPYLTKTTETIPSIITGPQGGGFGPETGIPDHTPRPTGPS